MLEGIIAFVFGLIYGSFLNVVILRFDDWLSLVKTPSHCPNCKQRLSWWDLIPVMSYITLKGKCRYCQKPISWQYPVVEIATGILLTGGYLQIFSTILPQWQQIISFALYIIAVGLIVTIFFHDFYEMMIPDLFAYLLLVAALGFGLIYYQDYLGTLYAALTGLIPIALLVIPSRGKWMGEGDIKIAGALGILIGWPNAVAFLALSFILGGIYGVVAVMAKKAKLKTAVPFAPFLIIAALLIFFWGTGLVGWYLGTIGYGYY